MTAEFNLIKQYFTRQPKHTDLGIGDDAALIQVSTGHQLAISTDMSVVGTHFFQDAAPYDIGWKSMAVNISDMAAMGANPRWATLSIALPEVNHDWLKDFAAGFFTCAEQFNVDLIGGDTTRGPLNISVTIMGEIPIGKAITRSNTKAGDDIWVSGHIGHAALGLAYLQDKTSQKKTTLNDETRDLCLLALNQPQPRIALGLALRDIANSCIDISDGLLADLSHILKASAAIGATLQLENMPCANAIKMEIHAQHIQQAILAGGDDYELCFTASPQHRKTIAALAKKLDFNITRIGETNTTGKLIVTFENKALNISHLGYEHFGAST